MKPKAKNKPRPIDIPLSLTAASRLLNLDRRTLTKRLELAGITAGPGKRFGLGELLRAVASRYSEARTRVSEATAEKLEDELALRRRETISRETVRQGLRQMMATLFGALENTFCSELPGTLQGLAPIEIKQRCEQSITALKKRLREELLKIGIVKKRSYME